MRKMVEQNRSPFAVDHGTLTSLISKKHKGGLAIRFPKLSRTGNDAVYYAGHSRVGKGKRKRRLSPFSSLFRLMGRQTASVLSEASEYIQFLHEQVKVLSAADLQATPAVQDFESPYSLRSRGLCLVPVSCTVGVASANGVDLWAPIKTTSPRLEKSVSDFH